MSHIKTIKSIGTKNYEIMVVELPNGQYQVMYEAKGSVYKSDPVNDYNTALFFFDVKLQLLEGH